MFQTWAMAERGQVREIDDDEGRRLLRIVRRGTGSVVTWRRAQMALLSAQKMPVAKIAEVTFTSEDRVRDVLHNFNADGFGSLYPKYQAVVRARATGRNAGRSRRSRSPSRSSTVCRSRPGVCRNSPISWRASRDPDYAVKKAQVEHLYAIADGEVIPEDDDPTVVFCLDEFGPLNLMPHPGRHWAAANNVEVAYTPTNSSWLNRIEAQFTALRYFALDGTDHRSHKEQGSMIRGYIIWRNRHADDTRLRQVVARANVA
jgi:hypothetical protein